MGAPATNPVALSDQTIATLALNTHKSGAVMGMNWANECADSQLRMYQMATMFQPNQTTMMPTMENPNYATTVAYQQTNPNQTNYNQMGYNQNMQ
jgi:hypothetical protein